MDEDRMATNVEATHGALYGSRLLNALLATDRVSRTEAYELVKALAQRALDTGTHLRELVADERRITEALGEADLDDLFRPDYYLRNISVAFERVGLKADR